MNTGAPPAIVIAATGPGGAAFRIRLECYEDSDRRNIGRRLSGQLTIEAANQEAHDLLERFKAHNVVIRQRAGRLAVFYLRQSTERRRQIHKRIEEG